MKRFGVLCGVLAILGFAAPARAELIQGSYNFTLGSVTVALVGGFGEIDWTPPVNVGVDGTPTYGTYEIDPDAGRTGVFTHGDFNTLNENELIQDMSENPGDANFVPQGPSGGVDDFFILTERPTWEFTETFLLPGQLGTPFFFVEQAGSTSVTIFLFGTAFDTVTPGLVSNWSAVISAQYVGWTIDELFNCLTTGSAGGNGTPSPCAIYGDGFALPNNTWSGTFVAQAAAIPEPATLLTFGLGTALLAAHRRRRAKARS